MGHKGEGRAGGNDARGETSVQVRGAWGDDGENQKRERPQAHITVRTIGSTQICAAHRGEKVARGVLHTRDDVWEKKICAAHAREEREPGGMMLCFGVLEADLLVPACFQDQRAPGWAMHFIHKNLQATTGAMMHRRGKGGHYLHIHPRTWRQMNAINTV
eukprot:1155635-Pelagomonas_calceolata.AAC.27